MSVVLEVGFFGDKKIETYQYISKSASEVARGIEEGTYKDAPERPFMRYTAEKNKKDWKMLFMSEFKKKYNKNTSFEKAIEETFKRLGKEVSQNIRDSMDEANAFAAIADSTRKRRNRKGFDSENPFIVTGGLYNSVEARIKKQDAFKE